MQRKLTRKFRHPKKRAFLVAFAKVGVIGKAAEIARIHRSMHHHWMKTDPDYPDLFHQAEEEAIEILEMEAKRRAVEGINDPIIYQGAISGSWVDKEGRQVAKDTPGSTLIPLTVKRYSDNLLMFILKAANPQKYRDNVHIDGSITISPDEMFLEIHRRATESAEIDVTPGAIEDTRGKKEGKSK